jgi:hypothetical protein
VTFLQKLIRDLGPRPASPLGPKPTDLAELEHRHKEAHRLTSLLEAGPRFSFVRLGDMDLALLLAAQEGEAFPEYSSESAGQTGTTAAGGPGISVRRAPRLRVALEQADYVDFHERLWPVGPLLPRLHLEPKPGQNRNPDATTSYILLAWMETEFRSYCERHRCGFVGGEVAVLEVLASRPEFRAAAQEHWPSQGEQFFHRPRADGARLDENLDLIKEDLKKFVSEHQIDTLFLALGGGAKILAYELAEEVGIRCVDFGAMLRALCYLGSRGDRTGRSTHVPFYHRLEFATVMDAIETALPDLPPEALLAKAHAQLILELQTKEVGWTHGSKELRFNKDTISAFRQAERRYRIRYRNLFALTEASKLERRRFLHFCGAHKLTAHGKVFLLWFQLKSLAKQLLKRCRRVFG